MDAGTLAIVAAAGLIGGVINGVVGSGTLITYPLLLAAGIPPVVANGTNTTGLSLAGFGAAWSYRGLLSDRWRRLVLLIVLTCAGSAGGALLVLLLPEKVFAAVVPWLILSAAAMVALQPLIRQAVSHQHGSHHRPVPLHLAAAAASVYGGYFGAGQGVVYMAILGAFYDDDPHQANAVKNLLAATANLTAAVVFISMGALVWAAALTLLPMALLGGWIGGHTAQRLSAKWLRLAVVAVGVGSAITILVRR